jgi:hypothetical protein
MELRVIAAGVIVMNGQRLIRLGVFRVVAGVLRIVGILDRAGSQGEKPNHGENAHRAFHGHAMLTSALIVVKYTTR